MILTENQIIQTRTRHEENVKYYVKTKYKEKWCKKGETQAADEGMPLS